MDFKAEKLKIVNEILGFDSYRTGDEYLYFCPFCNHHKRKLSVNLKKMQFHCWICEVKGSLTKLVRLLGSGSQKSSWRELNGQVDRDLSQVNESLFDSAEAIEEVIPAIELPAPFVSLVKNTTTAADKAPLKYLSARGVTKQDIFQWRIGYCAKGDYRGRIVVPSFAVDGSVNYFVGRTYTDSEYKYWNPKASKNLVFNELFVDWTREIVLVEGVFDAIVAKDNVVPILGSSLDQHCHLFQQIAMNDTPVVLGLDPDAISKTDKLIRALLEYGISIKTIDVPAKDIGELTNQEFLEARRLARWMSNDAALISMIERI